MDAVEDLLKTLDTTARSLDRPDLQPDPGRDDWGAVDAELTTLREAVDQGLLPKLATVTALLANDPGLPRLRDEVAFVVAEVAAVFHAAGKRDIGARYLEESLKAQPGDLVREEIEGARSDMDGYVKLVHGRWHNRTGDFAIGDPILKSARRGVSEPGLKAAYDRAINGPRPLTGGAPALFRLNGFGVSLYGDRDRRPDGTYISTHCICALFIPVWPIGAYRVRDAGHNAYEFFAKEQLSSFAKGYRWFVAAAVLLGIVWSAASGYLNSPQRLARIALEDAQEMEAEGNLDGALDAYQGVLDHHYGGSDVDGEASTGVMRLLVARVETPMTADRVDEAARIVTRYQELRADAQGGMAASLLGGALGEWATQVGTEPEAARRASLRLLDLGVEVAQGPDQEQLQQRATEGHVGLADELRDDWPLEALSHYVAAGGEPAFERAGALVMELEPSLFEDATTDISSVLVSGPEPARARINEVRQTLTQWRDDPNRTLALETGDVEALTTFHEVQPTDQEITAALADATRASGDVEAATALLTTIGGPGHLCARAQVALASCYMHEQRFAEADALLSRQVEVRLPVYAAASQAFDQASEGRIETLLRRAELGLDSQLNLQLEGASDEETRRVVTEWLRNQLDADPDIRSLREAMMAESSVVPTALMLGTIKLRRAHAATGDARQALLSEAERLFLAIRNEAEGVPEFHLNLGQVYHRLGRAEEGEAELTALLAQGDLGVSLQVAHAYRELGLVARARDVATRVYEQTENAVDLPIALPGQVPQTQIRNGAAILMSLLATRLEDEELWLSRANQDDDGVQIRLIQIRARRAYERRELRDAQRLFAQVARRYEAQGASDPASVNNAAIAYEEQYLCNGDDALLDRALTGLERALTLLPDNSLLISNLAELAQYRGDVELLSTYVDTRTLRLDPEAASTLVGALIAGPRGEEVTAALATNRHHQRARELTTQEQVLAPQRMAGWNREINHIGRVPNADALASAHQRLSQVQGLDTSAYADAMERERTEEDTTRLHDQLDSAIQDGEALVSAARRARSPATLAAALQLSARYYYSRAWERQQPEDAATGVAAARESASTWDGFSSKNLASGLLTQALLEAMPGTSLAGQHASDRARLSPVFLALRAAQGDGALMTALNGNAALDEAAQLRAATAREFLGVTDRAIGRLANHPGLLDATAHLPTDRRAALNMQIAELLTPGNPEIALWREQLE